jgi:replicative DNA helicase
MKVLTKFNRQATPLAQRSGLKTGALPANRNLPQSSEAEKALLSACIVEGGQESISACIEGKISPEVFYQPAHRLIFEALLSLYETGIPIDEVILADHLRVRQVFDTIGGHSYLAEITDRIATSAHLPYYIRCVRDAYLLRSIIRISSSIIENAYEGQEDVSQFLDQVERDILAIGEERVSDSAKPLRDTMNDAVNLVTAFLENKGRLRGVSSGFIGLDKMTFGFHPKEMIVIAARPSMGKTSLMLNIAEAAILPKSSDAKPVNTLMFSLEMGADQLAMRLLCSRARVSFTKLNEGFLPADQQRELVRCAGELRKAPLWIDDGSHLTILELRAKARRLHAQNPLGLIIVDYLQLVAGADSRAPREQQIAEISRGVKALAKELNVPVIIAAQLNRESEKERRQPRVSDLRESGSIEQDADVVILLAKKKDTDDEEDRAASVVLRDLILAKHRNGPVGNVPVAFTKNITRFENYTPQEI